MRSNSLPQAILLVSEGLKMAELKIDLDTFTSTGSNNSLKTEIALLLSKPRASRARWWTAQIPSIPGCSISMYIRILKTASIQARVVLANIDSTLPGSGLLDPLLAALQAPYLRHGAVLEVENVLNERLAARLRKREGCIELPVSPYGPPSFRLLW